MRPFKSLSALIIITLLLKPDGFPQSANELPKMEQTTFGSEDEKWQRPVPAPPEIINILREANHAPKDEFPSDSLLASIIHLRDAQETDFVVMGIHNLRPPHAALFWIFRRTSERYELILSTGGDSLTVLDARSKGYRQIRVENNTASTTTSATYSFDGAVYKISKQKTEPIA